MGARTCLLCGKPLSRIWAASGEDFCSREHRNQYRLRRGMDRLLEAGKVANVMRRRENPRQIQTAGACSGGPTSPRAFGNAPWPPDLQATGFAPNTVRPDLQNRLVPTSRFRPPTANAGQQLRERKAESRPLPFPPPTPAPPRMALSMHAHVMQAAPTNLPNVVANRTASGQLLTFPWRCDLPPVLGDMRKQLSTSTALQSAPAARRVAVPCEGRALRVSMAAGFRIPEWKLQARLDGPEITGMVWPGIRPLSQGGSGASASPKPAVVALVAPALCIPAPPAENFERRFEWPGVLGINIQFVNAANGQRTSFVPFGPPDDYVPKERR